MRAYSIDLRERVVKAVADGLSRREAARRLDVGAATAVRWAQQWATTGNLAAAVGKPGRSPLEAHADVLLDLWTKQPDITLEELQTELLAARGVTTGFSSIHRFFNLSGASKFAPFEIDLRTGGCLRAVQFAAIPVRVTFSR